MKPALLPCFILLLVPFAIAEEPEGAPDEPTFAKPTYWLRATGDRVYVRSGADLNSHPLTQVPENAVLAGVEAQGEWHKIVPPEGAYSYVAAEFIERIGGNRGIVKVNGQLRCRVGSTVFDLDPMQCEVQRLLPDDEQVEILGAEGEWLRIKPPIGVYGYISAQFVERIDADRARELREQGGASSVKTTVIEPASAIESGGDATGDPGADRATTATSQPAASPAPRKDVWQEKWNEVTRLISLEASKPIMTRDWGKLVAVVQPLADQEENDTIGLAARRWIPELKRRAADVEFLRRSASVASRGALPARTVERSLTVTYSGAADLKGLAGRGTLIRAPQGAGAAFALRNPASKRMIALLDFSGAPKLQPEKLLGREVGVKGKIQTGADLKVPLIQVTEIGRIEWVPAKRPAGNPS